MRLASFQTSYRAGEQVYRAIENGTSLIRPTGDGISLMTDYLGRVIASQNYSASNNGIMLANVPTRAYGPSTATSAMPSPTCAQSACCWESTWPGAPSAAKSAPPLPPR